MLRLLAALIALAPLGCIEIAADLPQICTTQTVQIAAPTAAVAAAVPSSTVAQEIDLAPDGSSFLTHLTLQSGSVTSTGSDLSFIDAMTIAVKPAQSGLQPISLVDYTRSGATTPDQIPVVATAQDLVPYLSSDGGTKLVVSITGRPPRTGATVAIDLCFGANVDKTFKLQP